MSAAVAFTWIVALGGLVGFYMFFITFELPRMHELLTTPFDPEIHNTIWRTVIQHMVNASFAAIWISGIAALLAVVGMIGLVLYSRRVTLRQMHEALAEISAKLIELQPRQQS